MAVLTTSRVSRRMPKAEHEALCRVYFIEAEGHDLIKIGYAIDLQKRFAGMMTSSPAPLTLLGILEGGPKLETTIHERLATHRAHGEWFHKTPEVMAVVATSQPAIGQEWLNQKARLRGAGLQEYLAKLKAGEVSRPTRGPNKQPRTKTYRYAWS